MTLRVHDTLTATDRMPVASDRLQCARQNGCHRLIALICLPFLLLSLSASVRRLRRLNLSGTGISYLPPSVLFARVAKEDPESEYKLNLDLSGTPVSSFLNWSHHVLFASAAAPEQSLLPHLWWCVCHVCVCMLAGKHGRAA